MLLDGRLAAWRTVARAGWSDSDRAVCAILRREAAKRSGWRVMWGRSTCARSLALVRLLYCNISDLGKLVGREPGPVAEQAGGEPTPPQGCRTRRKPAIQQRFRDTSKDT